MKKIDVLLASYNGEKYIGEQIKSVILNFDRIKNFDCKLIISDDNSTDNTVKIIEEICKGDPRVILSSTDRKGGVKENFEFLIGKVSGDYIFFCDQDDFWLPSKMEIFMQKFMNVDKGDAKPILIHSDLCVSDRNLSPINKSMFRYQNINKKPSFSEIITSNSVTGCVMACNKALIDISKNGNIKDSIMHDWYFAIIATVLGHVYFIDSPLILYRQHGGNQVGAKSFSIKEILKIKNIKYGFKKAEESIKDTQKQAGLFLNNYLPFLSEHQKELLELYSTSKKTSILKRFNLFCFNGVKKKGLIRNLVFFYIYVLLGA